MPASPFRRLLGRFELVSFATGPAGAVAGVLAAVMLGLVPAAGLAVGQDAADGESGVEAVRTHRITDPVGRWQRAGYAGMVPSIHLPTTHAADDLIHVWLRIPEGAAIDARWLPDERRWQLELPPGTAADRVEYYRIGGRAPGAAALYFDSAAADAADWTIADVRGTRVAPDGSQRFHVYRPVSGTDHADLAGWSWPRGDADLQARATQMLLEHCATTPRPTGKPPMGPAELDAMRRLNDCAGCHARGKPPLAFDRPGRSLERGTDNLGFYVPTAVLSDHCVVANHRPRDVNADDPFVTVRCGDAPAELKVEDGEEWYHCPGARVPTGHRDVRAALAAGHAYTERVCASRRWLYERMTARARRAFAKPLAACGLGKQAAPRAGDSCLVTPLQRCHPSAGALRPDSASAATAGCRGTWPRGQRPAVSPPSTLRCGWKPLPRDGCRLEHAPSSHAGRCARSAAG
jgi:hypothetical protein